MTIKKRNLFLFIGAALVIVGVILKINHIQGAYNLILFGMLIGQSGYMVELKAIKKENSKLKDTIVKLTNQRSA